MAVDGLDDVAFAVSDQPGTIAEAEHFFRRHIAVVTLDAQREGHQERQVTLRWLRSQFPGHTPPGSFVVGASTDQEMIGYALVGPRWHEASEVASGQRTTNDRYKYGSPRWLARFVAQVGNIDDVAVVPQWRGRGVGRALLNIAMQGLHERGARTVTAYATTPEAVALNRACGFTIGAPNEMPPRDHLGNLGLTPHQPGSPDHNLWCWRRL